MTTTIRWVVQMKHDAMPGGWLDFSLLYPDKGRALADLDHQRKTLDQDTFQLVERTITDVVLPE